MNNIFLPVKNNRILSTVYVIFKPNHRLLEVSAVDVEGLQLK